MVSFFRRRAAQTETRTSGALVALSDLRAAQWSGASSLAREGFERNPIVYRCVRMISEAAASLPFRNLAGEDDALARLMAEPNHDQAGPDLMESFYGHLLIAGEAYLEAVSLDGEVREVFVLRPDRMRPIKGARGHPLGWEHRVGAEMRRLLREADGFLPVLQMKLFHPSDDYSGRSPLEAAARAVDVHNAGGAWAKALIDNAARPSGALVYGGEALTEMQMRDLKEDLERSYQGAGNAGRPMLLHGGLDWKPMSLSPADMDFVEARHMAAREIALAFGVPPMLLGIPGDATYSNYREANMAFWRMTVLPLVNRAARAVSLWLGRRMGGARLAPDLDAAPAFHEERAEFWRRIDAAGFLTVEEKRKLAGVG